MGPFRKPTTPATHKPSYAGALPANSQDNVIALPMPPAARHELRFEMEVYARFMRHLREVPNSRLEMKVFAAIQFTATLMDIGDALVAKTLIDLGLRAPRRAFPSGFIDFVDRSILRTVWSAGGAAPTSIQDLSDYWRRIGEDPFAHIGTGAVSLAGLADFARA